jgi:pyruvate,orthophosphate dikinase
MGKTCVCGADAIEVSNSDRTATIGDIVIKEGDMISIDGSTGHVYLGELAVVPSPVSNYLENGLAAAIATENDEITALVKAVERILKHADSVRRLKVRTNADTAEDSKWARNLGAEGIGLCRTEHMFLGDRRVLIERVILADNTADRTAALDALLPMQQKDFEEIFEAMDNLPVTVRLLDPPLHEFLPDRADLMVEVALGKERNEDVSRQELLLIAVDRLHESNPMLGLRGVRLGLVVPGLFAMQVRAIAHAAIKRLRDGGKPKVEIMIPLVGSVMELHLIRDEIDVLLADIAKAENIDLPFSIGTMIELPRAALTAQRVAEAAEFFSFGTNDLTQTTWGFSRDDVEASFFATYLDRGIFTVSPFESLDVDGVGALIKIAVDKGRATRPDIKLGVCGEHGGDPESIKFFHDVGLDYVSCSPFRVPVARLEAGRVSIS